MTENKKFRLKYLHDEMNLKSPAFHFQCYHYHKVVFFIFDLVLKCYFSFAIFGFDRILNTPLLTLSHAYNRWQRILQGVGMRESINRDWTGPADYGYAWVLAVIAGS